MHDGSARGESEGARCETKGSKEQDRISKLLFGKMKKRDVKFNYQLTVKQRLRKALVVVNCCIPTTHLY